jgi:hypothetical protein
VRLVGVSAQASGRTAAVLIESTEPAAYVVSRPDPLTVLVDLHDVALGEVNNEVTRRGPVSSVTLERATAADGRQLARVRVTLSSPSSYKVRSARNVIRLELQPEQAAVARLDEVTASLRAPAGEAAAAPTTEPAPAAAPAKADSTVTPPATQLEKVRARHSRSATTVTLAGNGRLTPSSLTESDDQPRRLVLDFPNVAAAAAARTSVDSAFVKNVRVALNSKEPLVTRVTMEISSSATYHVERSGPDGRDLAVVFEGARPGGAVLVAPPTTGEAVAKAGADAQDDKDDTLTLTEAIANGAALAPADPITALDTTVATTAKSDAPRVLPPASRQKAAAAARSAQTTAPAQQQAQQQQTPPPPAPAPTTTAYAPTSGVSVPETVGGEVAEVEEIVGKE